MNIKFHLPSIYERGIEEKELEDIKRFMFKQKILRYFNLTNSGIDTAILCSNTDGYRNFSAKDNLSFLIAGKFYKLLIGEKAHIFPNATSSDLREVIRNREFENVFVIGHSSYHSWGASDKSLDFKDLAEMVGLHLKRGIFANLGCGRIDSWNKIPLGYFVVSNHQNLFGRYAELINDVELLRPKELVRLSYPRFSELTGYK